MLNNVHQLCNVPSCIIRVVIYGMSHRLTLSRARVIIARKSPGHAFLASFNRNMARKRYPYCQGYNGFWSVVYTSCRICANLSWTPLRHLLVLHRCRVGAAQSRYNNNYYYIGFFLDQRSRGHDKPLGIAVTDILRLPGEC